MITRGLNNLGKTITIESAKTSRVLTGDLRDSQNYRTKPYNVLTVSQNTYGKGLFLKGKNSGPKNALKVSVEKHTPPEIKVIMENMVDLLKSPIRKK